MERFDQGCTIQSMLLKHVKRFDQGRTIDSVEKRRRALTLCNTLKRIDCFGKIYTWNLGLTSTARLTWQAPFFGSELESMQTMELCVSCHSLSV
jgi:hypothetical protein